MKINSNLNKNFNTPKKQTTFGVRKTDSVQSFINEIRTSNPNLGDLERLPIVQKMKKSDTLEQFQERANADRSMFENKCSFNIADKKGFTIFINSICIKIMNELRQLGKTVEKFIVQVEDENGNKKEKDIVRAFKNRLSVKASHKRNPEKIKEGNKKYYEDNKDEIREKQKEFYKKYYETHSEELKQKQKQYHQHNPEKIKEIKKKYYKNNKDKILEKRKEYYENNKDEISEKQKEYRQNNPEKIKEINKKYYKKNKDKILKKHKEKATLKKQEKEVIEFLSELINRNNGKN